MNLQHGRIQLLKTPQTSVLHFESLQPNIFQWKEGKKHPMILSLILPLLPTHSRKPFENELSTPKNLLQIPRGVLLSFQPSLAFARVRNKFCFLSFYCWIRGPSLLWTSPTCVSLPRLHIYRNLFPFVSCLGQKCGFVLLSLIAWDKFIWII